MRILARKRLNECRGRQGHLWRRLLILGEVTPIATLGDQGKVNVTNVVYKELFVSAARMRVGSVEGSSQM
jgi:hypothetical protein